MRGNIGGHPDRDARGPIDQEVGKAGGQDQGFFGFAVIIGLEVDGVLIEFIQEFQRHGCQACFGIAIGGRRVTILASEVSVAVDERGA